MHGPVVVSWLLALLCAAIGGYCLTLARRGTAPARATARIEASMGLGMAAMALPGDASLLPGGLFVALFGALAAWSGWSAWSARRPGPAPASHPDGHRGHAGHGMHHMVEALAMAYMAVVMRGTEGGGAHPGHGGAAGGVPVVTGGLLLYFAAFALCTGARLLPAAAAGPSSEHGACAGRPPVPGSACRLTLALGSFTMLLNL